MGTKFAYLYLRWFLYVCVFLALLDIPYTGKQNGVSKEERKSSSKYSLFTFAFCLFVFFFYFLHVLLLLGGSDYSMGDSRRLSEAGVRRSSGLYPLSSLLYLA